MTADVVIKLVGDAMTVIPTTPLGRAWLLRCAETTFNDAQLHGLNVKVERARDGKSDSD